MPAAELEPLERLPRLGPGRRRAEDCDGALERGALRRDGARVVARVGLLLVRGVVLLVDADHAERGQRREDRRAGADDDGRLSRGDPLPLVAPLGVGESGVEDGDAVAEAGEEAAERLRRQRDLGDEHDRAAAAGERRLAGADVDLGLAAAGRAREQDVAAAGVEERLDPRERPLLRFRQPLGRRLGGERVALRHPAALAPPLRLLRRDESERPGRRRAVVLGEPEREVDERGGDGLRDALDGRGLDACGSVDADLGDHAARRGRCRSGRHDGALLHLVGHLVREGAGDRAGADERVDGGEARHRASVLAGKVGAVGRFQWSPDALSRADMLEEMPALRGAPGGGGRARPRHRGADDARARHRHRRDRAAGAGAATRRRLGRRSTGTRGCSRRRGGRCRRRTFGVAARGAAARRAVRPRRLDARRPPPRRRRQARPLPARARGAAPRRPVRARRRRRPAPRRDGPAADWAMDVPDTDRRPAPLARGGGLRRGADRVAGRSGRDRGRPALARWTKTPALRTTKPARTRNRSPVSSLSRAEGPAAPPWVGVTPRTGRKPARGPSGC